MAITKFDQLLLPDDFICDVNTKKYTVVPATRIHICAKCAIYCSNGVASIVSITEKQTDRQTDNDHTCKN